MNFTFIEAVIENFYVHKVGNKIADEQYFIAKRGVDVDDNLKTLLSHYFLSSFKSDELYCFSHSIEISLNEVYSCVNKIFKNSEELYEQSVNLAKHLYDQNVHPKIKGGEFYVVYFKNCILDGEIKNAVGLFKSENKDTFLEIEQVKDGFDMDSKKGININKLDKGCLIFDTGKENGYILSIVDNTNKGNEAQYWKDNFLNVLPVKNQYHQTNQFLGLAKQFVTNQLSEEFKFSKAEKIDLLNRSVDYFKKNEIFNKQVFESEVFEDSNIIESFRKFDEIYRQENEIELLDTFEISSQAVKKQSRVFKSILKLDKNFDIYIHGNSNLIEQGIDENGRKYYKIFYEKEN
ncbi:nucleoid-associated protein [Chryseobacterium wangxinyae]|uniref:nucleoid-associated protein n=1 Tax=Chryseobacterium sp. CY353 TaxID=2997334 RepID=UPI0022706CB1|nr:nucleoid-associated protein [Chryseobacterium sp. CY353]MCY0970278.1 nucleoid-associated protein [Chryseobacterium sp. CY353]